MRIVTRPDFDGVVCAVVFYEACEITEAVNWVEPNEMQNNLVEINEDDIIANLPFHENCALWFDHHYSNITDIKFNGSFKIAPSAAGVAYEFFREKITKDFSELIKETDRIDSADLTVEEVLNPENYPYLLISMTIVNKRDNEDIPYWNHLVSLLRTKDIHGVLEDTIVRDRCDIVVKENQKYKEIIKQNSKLEGDVVILDLREFEKAPNGNRFIHYSMYPESNVSMKIRRDDNDREKIVLSVGHNIFNKTCMVNVGKLLKNYNGGGHRGAGACSFHQKHAAKYIPEILNVLVTNKKND